MFPYSRQNIDSKDISEVKKSLKSDIIVRGSIINKFEKKVSKFVDVKYAVAVNSATSALHIACKALELSKDDIAWTVPNTFVASANCARHCGSKIDFVDIDEKTWNISPEKLEKKLQLAKKFKRLPKVIITVHFGGQPTEQKKIWNLSKKYKFKIIEDASHSIGAKHYGEKVGSCKWSDITVFSFHPVKIITTTEGGMALTNDKKLFEKLKIYRNHGITKDLNSMKKKIKATWYYEQIELGYNFWMSDIQAALGLNQLKRIKLFIKKRNQIAKLYNKLLDKEYIQTPSIEDYNLSSFHLYVIKLDLKKINKKYNQIFKIFRDRGIGVNLHYLPVHLQPYYKKLGFKEKMFPVAEDYAKKAFSIPIYYNLSRINQLKIIKIINNVCKIK